MTGPLSSTWRSATIALGAALMATSLFQPAAGGQEPATPVEPSELIRRADLVGKLVVVDDRIRFFQNHPRFGYDELYLKRTPIAFRLSPELRPDVPPRQPAVLVQGRLGRDGQRLVVDVTALELQPTDLERFDKAIASLPPRDFETRRRWTAWAAKRAKDFGDKALASRAEQVAAEAVRIEGDSKRSTVDAPAEWLAIAEQARKRGVPEPEPSAQAHRAFRAMLAAADSPADLDRLRRDVERFFPESARPPAASGPAADSSGDSAEAYRTAEPEARKLMDRNLWADVVQKGLEREIAQDVPSAMKIVDRAAQLVPDRPRLVSQLVGQVLTQARADPASLRVSDVKAIGELLSGHGEQAGGAVDFYREWLTAQRDRLSPTDAEGPTALAPLYEELIHDPEEARRLLERAWRVAPGSEAVAEAFRVRGYRRVGDDWVKDSPQVEVAASTPAVEGDQGLRGKSPAEVRAVMGVEPMTRNVTATKGRVILQWVFEDSRQRRYVNFLYVPGSTSPRVASDFLLPR